MSDLKTDIQELVRQAGFPVHQGSKFCLKFLNDHPHTNCRGCESEHGCSRVAVIVRLTQETREKIEDKPIGIQILEAAATAHMMEDIMKNGVIDNNYNDGVFNKTPDDLI